MKTLDLITGCACCRINRRRFLAAGCAACAGAAGFAVDTRRVRAAETPGTQRIRIIYALHADKQAQPDWPNIGFDFNPVMQRIEMQLQQQCPQFEFVVSMANGPEQAKAIVDADRTGNIDGYLVYQLNCWNQVVQPVAASGKPVLYADFQYGGSGGFLVYTAGFLRTAHRTWALSRRRGSKTSSQRSTASARSRTAAPCRISWLRQSASVRSAPGPRMSPIVARIRWPCCPPKNACAA